MNLLLLSNSSSPGQPYLGWAQSHLQTFIPSLVNHAVFIPFAAVTLSWDEYVKRVELAWPSGTLTSLHSATNPVDVLASADLVVVGGGNTFQLVNELYKRNLFTILQDRVRQGLPYIGWSAGANIAAPTLGTTNDMPIVKPPSFQCLNLVPYQINPHFTRNVIPGHGGESRVDRLREYCTANPSRSVIALPEGTGILVKSQQHQIIGQHPAVLFRHGTPEQDIPKGTTNILPFIQT